MLEMCCETCKYSDCDPEEINCRVCLNWWSGGNSVYEMWEPPDEEQAQAE